MSGQAGAVVMRRRAWSEDDWDEYRQLPWLGRRLADLTRLIPATEQWLAPLIGLHAQYVRRRNYEKARRRSAVVKRAPLSRPSSAQTVPSLRR